MQYPTYLSVAALHQRGWTASMIRDHLGDSDTMRPNPHYSSTASCRLYDLSRVEAVEHSEMWQAAQNRAHQRQARAQAAIETKRANLLAEIEQLKIVIPRVDMDMLMCRVCDNYNEHQAERGNWSYDPAKLKSDPAFLRRITVNYLRHVLSTYEEELARRHGKVGIREAYQAIIRKVYTAISSTYPVLAEECDRQLRAKTP